MLYKKMNFIKPFEFRNLPRFLKYTNNEKHTGKVTEPKGFNENHFFIEHTILLLLKNSLICFIRINSLPMNFNLKKH